MKAVRETCRQSWPALLVGGLAAACYCYEPSFGGGCWLGALVFWVGVEVGRCWANARRRELARLRRREKYPWN